LGAGVGSKIVNCVVFSINSVLNPRFLICE